MHTESRKRARLMKQNLIYRRNQQEKMQSRTLIGTNIQGGRATIE